MTDKKNKEGDELNLIALDKADNRVNRKRPVKSFTLSENVITGLDEISTYTDIKNISQWVNDVLEIAIRDKEHSVSYVGMRRQYKPITFMLRAEIVDYIEYLLSTGGYGLPKRVTPLDIAQKLSAIIGNDLPFGYGDMTCHLNEMNLANLKTSTAERNSDYRRDNS